MPTDVPNVVRAGDLSGAYIGRQIHIPALAERGYLSDYEPVHNDAGTLTWILVYKGGIICYLTALTDIEVF